MIADAVFVYFFRIATWKRTPFLIFSFTVFALLFQGHLGIAQHGLLDPGLNGRFKALYRTNKADGDSGQLTLLVERKTIEGMDVDEFIRHNADPIWLHQNEMWEYMETETEDDTQDDEDMDVPF